MSQKPYAYIWDYAPNRPINSLNIKTFEQDQLNISGKSKLHIFIAFCNLYSLILVEM